MKLGDEHCRDGLNERDPLRPIVGLMRRLQGNEHVACMCGGTWTGNGYARMLGNNSWSISSARDVATAGSPTTDRSRQDSRSPTSVPASRMAERVSA